MATIEDVARAAGVSSSTVSYVLSQKRSISAPTRRRVEQAIADLGYRPHMGARALASRRTHVIGLMAPLRSGVDVSVIMQFVTGVVTRARDFEHDVLLLTQDDVTGVERVAAGSMVDAIVVMDVEADDERIPLLGTVKQPAVLIGLPRDAGGLSCVDLDFEATGRLAARHLAQTGHRDVVLIGSPPEVMARHTSYADRVFRGFTAECAQSSLTGVVQACGSTPDAARSAVDAVLDQAPDTTGFVVHNERALPHVLAHLRERGRDVGRDTAVVAVCPHDIALSQHVPMTSIDIPGEVIGAVAVEMAMARLENARPSETRLLAPVLTERGSSAQGPGTPG
ncbi:LacI family DNA-binding transcriptional regulator [Isoptericola halotolerans]|uniref:DNA-binding LacI/PurR family transcriptional regulator n=1 Tax=Isoptericola halotolerans TaxID=300560 RepID=A0ABX2A4C7_9MICO|nr:LacI family DNA-binding transcriptional regulator [Isoptericola halotolerans]NOV97707.1 DNA-binding LacI/PurR family transcriptional regulator [Isoptericola halotolerans]